MGLLERIKLGKSLNDDVYKKGTFVISATAACGKSYCYNNYNGDPWVMLDSDSSKFGWMTNFHGEKVRNPSFVKDYIQHIKNNIGKVDIIFVSAHEEVRDALEKNNIKYFMIHPALRMKDIWLDRMRERGDNENFIKFQKENFEKFILEIKKRDDINFQGTWPTVSEMYRDPIIRRIQLTEDHPYIDKQLIDTIMYGHDFILGKGPFYKYMNFPK